jgi:methylmalonyl-CoA/ethylmalonyl-CoA epimerase
MTGETTDATLAAALESVGARYDHTAVAGRSLAPMVRFYRDVLGGTFCYGEVLPIGAVTAVFSLGDGKIELMAPTPGSTFFDRFFAGNGGRGGQHHITFDVDDIDAAVAVLDAHGIEHFGLVHDPMGYWSEVFVHPRSNGGVLVQLAQIGDFSDVVTRDLHSLVAAAL